MVRINEAQVAEHYSAVFRQYYDQRSAETTHILVSALQETRDTITPLLDLPSKPSTGIDREERFSALLDYSEKMKADKQRSQKEMTDPIKPSMVDKFIEASTNLDSKLISKQTSIKEKQ